MTTRATRSLDSHCHLVDAALTNEVGDILRRAKQAGIAHFFCNATREDDWERIAALSRRNPEVIAFLGIHPWWSDTATGGWEERLAHLLQQTPAGVGETGLDKQCHVDFSKQEKVFCAQLELASTLQRPLVIHCVKAWGRALELLEARRKSATLPPMMVHSFSGSVETLRRLIQLDCYLSFSCRVITNDRLHPCLRETPLDRLLLESDAPAHNNQPCQEPADIVTLYQQVSRLRGMDIEELIQQIWKNGEIFAHNIFSR